MAKKLRYVDLIVFANAENLLNARISSLINGTTKSCGCYKNDNVSKNRITHGKTNEILYRVWANIIQRCENEKIKNFKNYGGRGIAVCDEWRHDFIAFYNWAIANRWSKGLEIDRRNNDGNYEPGNCRIVTRKINCNNTRRCKMFMLEGVNMTLTEICNHLKLNYNVVHQRIFKYKWSFEQAIKSTIRKSS